MNAYITGTDRGLGAAFVEILLSKGFTVFAGRYNPFEGNDGDYLLQKYKERLHIVSLDVSDDDSVYQAANTIRSKTDKIDLLINNAGILGDYKSTLADKLNFEDMKKTFDVNALGPLRVTQSVLDLIINGDLKKIVNISSEASSISKVLKESKTDRIGYRMSKNALNIHTAITSNYVKAFGIDIHLIEPGWMKTYMRGVKGTQGDLEPEESATLILDTILEKVSKELFIDLYGNRFEW